jgi:hypothetical protein
MPAKRRAKAVLIPSSPAYSFGTSQRLPKASSAYFSTLCILLYFLKVFDGLSRELIFTIRSIYDFVLGLA